MNSSPFEPLTMPLVGVNLIDASAGTGKTYSITTLFLRLLLEQGLQVQDILVVTFTEAATAELRDRIRTRMRQARDYLDGEKGADETLVQLLAGQDSDKADLHQKLTQALANIDDAAIFTIHGFCARTLADSAFESGAPFESEMVTQISDLLDEVTFDFWTRQLHSQPAWLIQALLDQGLSTSSLTKVAQGVLRPGCEMVPPGMATPPQPPDLESAFGDLCAAWDKHSPEVMALKDELVATVSRYTDSIVLVQLADLKRLLSGRIMDLKALLDLTTRYSSSTIASKPMKNKTPPTHPFFDACETFAQAHEPLSDYIRDFKLHFVHHVQTEIPARMQARGLQSFDDLIVGLDKALARDGDGLLIHRIRNRYQAAMIDEFQDTDPVQWRVFYKLFAGREEPLFLIGDPKQSIYGFRSADIFSYLRAARDTDKRFTMDTNYRSDPGLIQGVNSLFSSLKSRCAPFMDEGIPFEPVHANRSSGSILRQGKKVPAIQLRFLPREGRDTSKPWAHANLGNIVASDLCTLLQDGTELELDGEKSPVRPGDVAVLVRSHNQARRVERALAHRHIPTVRVSNESVFASNEAMALAVLLAAVSQPARSSKIRAALACDIIGLNADQIHSLSDDEAAWDSWLERFAHWRSQWHERGFMAMLQIVLDCRPEAGGPRVRERIVSRQGGERSLTNLRHLSELLQAEITAHHLRPEAQVRWLEQQRADPKDATGATELRLESDENAVQIVTIFKAKGLEYPVVFCPYLWDGFEMMPKGHEPVIFHSQDEEHRAQLFVGTDEDDKKGAKAIHEAERRAETMRMLYVAFTRARHHLVLHWGIFKDAQKSALAYLLHSPKGELSLPKVQAAITKKDDEELLQELADLKSATKGNLEVTQVALPPDSGPVFHADQPKPTELSCLKTPRVPWVPLNTASFSRLAKQALAHAPLQRDGLDRDEPDEGQAASSGPLPLAEMPRGVKAGDFFHDLYEHLDFTRSAESSIETLVVKKLKAHGFDHKNWSEAVVKSVRQCLTTTLHDSGLQLGQISPSKKICEMEFFLPAEDHGQTLAQAFRAGASPQVPQEYVKQLESLSLPNWRGFLKGFIDLTFVHEDRWYLLDYKSNHLGTHHSDYTVERLQHSMADHHYYLQYHLYSLALWRYLKSRMKDYHHQQHFGGVFYLYLRGMSPEHGPKRGVFFDRPSEKMLLALEDVIGRAGS